MPRSTGIYEYAHTHTYIHLHVYKNKIYPSLSQYAMLNVHAREVTVGVAPAIFAETRSRYSRLNGTRTTAERGREQWKYAAARRTPGSRARSWDTCASLPVNRRLRTYNGTTAL